MISENYRFYSIYEMTDETKYEIVQEFIMLQMLMVIVSPVSNLLCAGPWSRSHEPAYLCAPHVLFVSRSLRYLCEVFFLYLLHVKHNIW